MSHQSYFTRALRARDGRFARIFGKMGYETTSADAEQPEASVGELRAEYQRVLGKKPFNGWDAATLAAKIAEAMKA